MRILLTLCIQLLALTAFASVVEAQSRRPDAPATLEQQVARLTEQVNRLESLVRQLQAGSAQDRPGAAYALVERGMSRREVVLLLGEPLPGSNQTFWYYPPARPGGTRFMVDFNRDTVRTTSYYYY